MTQVALALTQKRIVLFSNLSTQFFRLRDVLAIVTVQRMKIFRLKSKGSNKEIKKLNNRVKYKLHVVKNRMQPVWGQTNYSPSLEAKFRRGKNLSLVNFRIERQICQLIEVVRIVADKDQLKDRGSPTIMNEDQIIVHTKFNPAIW